jgi:hypothetical protein
VITEGQARDEIFALLQAAWDAGDATDGATLLYENTDERRPTAADGEPAVWAWAHLRNVTSRQSSLLMDGTDRKRYTTYGFVGVQMFTPAGDGGTLMDQVSAIVLGAYRGKRTTGGVIFKNVRAKQVGASGPWFQSNAIAEYEFDTVE